MALLRKLSQFLLCELSQRLHSDDCLYWPAAAVGWHCGFLEGHHLVIQLHFIKWEIFCTVLLGEAIILVLWNEKF